MESLLEGLAATPLAQWIRYSRWGYAIVNTAHVFGVALLVGASVPLNLRLLGVWRGVKQEPLARILAPMAACGLALAIITGSLLFLTDPLGYVGLNLFLIKIGLVFAATIHALTFYFGKGFSTNPIRLKLVGGLSLVVWLCVLVMGRFIAFVDN